MPTNVPLSTVCDVIGCGEFAAFVHVQPGTTLSEERLCNSCVQYLSRLHPDLKLFYRQVQPLTGNTNIPFGDGFAANAMSELEFRGQ